MKERAASDVPPGMDVLLLDNRDSFTWNLAQAFGELGATVAVLDACAVTADDVLTAAPALVCVGPGPRGPKDLPHLLELLRGVDGRVPILGVCLGLQALVLAHGGVVGRARAPVHGKRSPITHGDTGLFTGLPNPLWVMRYHSLVAVEVPSRFTVVARDHEGQVMALRDPEARVDAVQFHPESVGTAGGMHLLAAALRGAGVEVPPWPTRPGAVPQPSASGPEHPEALYGRGRAEVWDIRATEVP